MNNSHTHLLETSVSLGLKIRGERGGKVPIEVRV
jgi:hypothetical protein